MFGILKDIVGSVGEVVGSAVGIAITPIAIALNVSEVLVRRAVNAGCKTQREIQEWIKNNT